MLATAPTPTDLRYPYRPHPRQQAFHACRAQEVMYGGAAGGGKSDALIAAGVLACLQVPGIKVILFRRTFPQLKQEIIPRMRERLRGIATYHQSDHIFTFPNGATFRLGYLRTDKDLENYQGPEYGLILWDELTHFTRFQYTYMRSRLRVTGAVADRMAELGWIPRMLSGTNPGSSGHAWVKEMFVDPSPGRDQPFLGGINADDDPSAEPMVLAYIPAKATDNPHLDLGTYHRTLSALGDPILIRALRDGDWDILEGVRFTQFRRGVHVIEPQQLPIPLIGYPRAVGVDWGISAPFCALWGALLPDYRVVIYRELYGANLTAQQQARLIQEAEAPGERLPDRPIPLALDPSCWARPSNTAEKSIDPNAPAKGSIAWWYRQVFGGQVTKADNDRLGGWGLFDHLMQVRDDGLPGLLIYSTCTNLIRTLPALPRAKTNPEDVDTHAEDHAADAGRYLLKRLVGGGHNRASPAPSGAVQLPQPVGAAPADLAIDTRLTVPAAAGPAEAARNAARRRVPFTPGRSARHGYTDS